MPSIGVHPLSNDTPIRRIGTALIGGPVIFLGILWSNLAMLALTVLLVGCCLREFMRILRKLDMAPLERTGLLFAALFLADAHLTHGAHAMELIAGFLLVTTPHFLQTNLPDRGVGIALTVVGTLYLTILPGMLILMRNPDPAGPWADSGGVLVGYVLILIWALDTGAYTIGKLFGRTPFFHTISPKKTWEGAIGGLACCILLGMLAWWVYVHRVLGFGDALAMAVLAGIAGTMGDLIQSRIKRLARIKDTANVIPGHGGVWDRFDSLIFAVPVLYGYVYLWAMKPTS